MTDNNKTLVSAGHELASELKADCGAVDVRGVANLLTELASALDVQSARSDALSAELARYSMPAGEADQRMAESRAVRQALGFGQDADDVAPVDLVERINALAAALKASEANDADARCHVAELEEKCSELAVENSGMDAFVAAMLSIAWQGGTADGADIENLALENGLLRQEVYSADAHENLVGDPGNFEEGDPVYSRVENPATDAWVNEQRAHDLNAFIQHYSEKLDVHIRNGGEQFDSKSNELRNLIVSARLFREQLRGGQV